jgi:hypothetical protein
MERKTSPIILSDNDLMDVFILFLEDLIRSLKTIDDEKNIPLILNEKVGILGQTILQK